MPWYVGCLSSQLGRRAPVAREVLGTPVALFRDGAGRPAAVLDRCPHRNVPLSMGRVTTAGLLQCAYHGWSFDGEGACRDVPGLEGDADRAARRVDRYPATEQDGMVWVWPDADPDDSAGRPVRLPAVDDPAYTTVRRSGRLPAGLHACLENTLDVPHTAFLHGGLFRSGRTRTTVEVTVRHTPVGVEAVYDGEPRPSGLAGRLLAPEGGVVQHVDRFLLPSIAQVEYRLGRNHLLVTTAFTPVADDLTAFHSAVTFSLAIPPAVARALVTPIADRILAQDRRILAAQTAAVRRFGGEHFMSTPLDVLGNDIHRMLQRAERGSPLAEAVADRHLVIRV